LHTLLLLEMRLYIQKSPGKASLAGDLIIDPCAKQENCRLQCSFNSMEPPPKKCGKVSLVSGTKSSTIP